jgi:hypothetical protein
LWEATAAAGAAQDGNHAADAYEVVEWEARGEFAALTGAPLREIYATLRRVRAPRTLWQSDGSLLRE